MQLQAALQDWFGPTDLALFVMGIMKHFSVTSFTQHVITVFPVGREYLRQLKGRYGGVKKLSNC